MAKTTPRIIVRTCLGIAILTLSTYRVHATYEQEVLADEPFVYFRFEDEDADQAIDSSGNDLHGEYIDGADTGEPSATDGLGNAVALDGASGYIQLDVLDLEAEQFTIETWIYLELLAGGCCTSIFSPDGWEPGWLHYNLRGDGNVEFALNSGGPNNHNSEPDSVPFEEWTHVASVYDMDEALVRTFINGEEVDVFPPDFQTPLPVALIVEAQIGAWQNTRFLGGLLDEFAIYDSALSEDRILAHYNAAFNDALPGDFNGNGELDAGDLDSLSQGQKDNDVAFDLTADGMTDVDDRLFWINELKNSWMGDADLNGEFNTTDLVNVFQAGKFETEEMAGWAQGDWNGDMLFNTSDFIIAFQSGGFEKGPRVAAVPEPTIIFPSFVAFMAIWISARFRLKRKS